MSVGSPGGGAAARAFVLHALGVAGGELSWAALAASAREEGGPPPADLERAVEELEEAELVALSAATLREGARGSLLSAAAVRESLATRWLGHPLEVHAVLPSTNERVLESAASGAARGLTVACELQTAGRGRRGRSFESAPGLGVWCSALLDSPEDPAAAPRLSLICGLAVVDAIREETSAAARLKWPNDVRLGGRKVCGILVEARSAGGRLHPVAGIGVNVHHRAGDFPPEIRSSAGSLEGQTGRRVSRSRLLARLLGALERLLEEEAAGALDLPARFAPHDELAGREVNIDLEGEALRGTACGVAPDGSLLLEVAGAGVRRLRFGDVALVDASSPDASTHSPS
jgi:BirA family biotin operon repressor/biotin-[acetyl-CoA-carboxylase] ligase